jgi:ribose transport system substrate-binding protein
MGYKTMGFLHEIVAEKKMPSDPTYTGLDVCTPQTADSCIAK